MVKDSLDSVDTHFNLYKSSLTMQICNLNLKDNKSEVGGGHSGISPSDSNVQAGVRTVDVDGLSGIICKSNLRTKYTSITTFRREIHGAHQFFSP